MKYLPAVVGILCSSLSLGTALAAPPPVSQAAMNKKLLISCMTKQMTASRTISYNEATKVCKSQLKSQGDELVASNATKPGTAH
jgi:hypothetical protein